MTDDQFWQAILQCLHGLVDAIERWRFPGKMRSCKLRQIGKRYAEVEQTRREATS